MGTNVALLDTLKLSASPRVEDIVDRKGVKLFDLMVVALIERDAPMSIEEVAARLVEAGAVAGSGNMVVSLKKAWHGREPVYKTPDGRFALNPDSPYMVGILFRTGLRQMPSRRASSPERKPELPGDDVPLSEKEFRALYHYGRCLSGVSDFRLIAAILDVRGRALSRSELDADPLQQLTATGRKSPATLGKIKPGALIVVEADGSMRLDASSPDLPKMRSSIRKLVGPSLKRIALEEQSAHAYEEYKQKTAAHAEEAAKLRRAVVRTHPDRGRPQAATILDVGAHTLATYVGPQIDEFAAALESYDVLVGIGIREALFHLGLDAERWKLVDIAPPRKSIRLNRAGRTLRPTLKQFIAATTSISRPLGEPDRVARYLASGETGKLARRLESDAKAVYAFYRYGVLHRCVRLRWGFLDETYPVEWAERGDPSIHQILHSAEESGAELEIVLGTAPGWQEPWSRARRCTVLADSLRGLLVSIDGERVRLDPREIQAAREAGDPHAARS